MHMSNRYGMVYSEILPCKVKYDWFLKNLGSQKIVLKTLFCIFENCTGKILAWIVFYQLVNIRVPKKYDFKVPELKKILFCHNINRNSRFTTFFKGGN